MNEVIKELQEALARLRFYQDEAKKERKIIEVCVKKLQSK